MHAEIEAAAREILSRLLVSAPAPAELDASMDLTDDYGLTSLNKVVFLISLCDETGTDLARFTEQDVSRMRTLRDVTEAFGSGVESAA